jgi:hypothetical protein
MPLQIPLQASAVESPERTLWDMQPIRPAFVPLLMVVLSLMAFAPRARAVPKTHTVTLGGVRRVPYTPAEASSDTKSEDSSTLHVRSLMVDGVHREWTVGEPHDVTDRSFTVRRAMRLNDALPGEAPRWVWQPGPWLLVDRVTGHITALHLPAFDADVSEVEWFRDYAAYCGITTTRAGGLVATVAELGHTKAVVQKLLSKWPMPDAPHPVCARPQWQRSPMRATITPTGGQPITFDVVGTSSLVEDNEPAEPQ